MFWNGMFQFRTECSEIECRILEWNVPKCIALQYIQHYIYLSLSLSRSPGIQWGEWVRSKLGWQQESNPKMSEEMCSIRDREQQSSEDWLSRGGSETGVCDCPDCSREQQSWGCKSQCVIWMRKAECMIAGDAGVTMFSCIFWHPGTDLQYAFIFG